MIVSKALDPESCAVTSAIKTIFFIQEPLKTIFAFRCGGKRDGATGLLPQVLVSKFRRNEVLL